MSALLRAWRRWFGRRPRDPDHYEHRGPIDLLGDSMAVGTCRTCGTTIGAAEFGVWT